MKHEVEYVDGYGYSDFCKCGRQSVMCQKCGNCVCITEHNEHKGTNVCGKCFLLLNSRNKKKPVLKGNPAYDLMM